MPNQFFGCEDNAATGADTHLYVVSFFDLQRAASLRGERYLPVAGKLGHHYTHSRTFLI